MSSTTVLAPRSSCPPGVNCEKPTSKWLTDGVPAIVTGTFVIVALIVCVILYHKRKRRDDQEDIEDRRRNSGYYVRDGLTRFGRGGGADVDDGEPLSDYNRGPSSRKPMYPATGFASNRSSDASFGEVNHPYKSSPYSSSAVDESSTDLPHRTGDGWRDLVNGDRKNPSGALH